MSTKQTTLHAVSKQAPAAPKQPKRPQRTPPEASFAEAVRLSEVIKEDTRTLVNVQYHYTGVDDAECETLRSLVIDDLEKRSKALGQELRALKQRYEPAAPAAAAA